MARHSDSKAASGHGSFNFRIPEVGILGSKTAPGHGDFTFGIAEGDIRRHLFYRWLLPSVNRFEKSPTGKPFQLTWSRLSG